MKVGWYSGAARATRAEFSTFSSRTRSRPPGLCTGKRSAPRPFTPTEVRRAASPRKRLALTTFYRAEVISAAPERSGATHGVNSPQPHGNVPRVLLRGRDGPVAGAGGRVRLQLARTSRYPQGKKALRAPSLIWLTLEPGLDDVLSAGLLCGRRRGALELPHDRDWRTGGSLVGAS